MSEYYSPGARGFHHSSIHRDAIPADAVRISAKRKRELMDAQAADACIEPDHDGRLIAIRSRLTLDQRRAALLHRVRREAARRIEAIAPLWRQANDNAAIAMAALEERIVGHIEADFLPAIDAPPGD